MDNTDQPTVEDSAVSNPSVELNTTDETMDQSRSAMRILLENYKAQLLSTSSIVNMNTDAIATKVFKI